MQETIKNLTIIIPVYNPDSSLVDTVDGLLKKGFQDIIVVNDGSDAGHQIPLQQIEDKCTLIHHRDRRGRDKAIRTATAFCMENRRQSSGAIIVQIEKRQRPEEIYACAENFVQNEYRPKDNAFSRRLFRILHGLKRGEAISFEEKKAGRYKTMLVNYRGIG